MRRLYVIARMVRESFQSTHPKRDETFASRTSCAETANFNPLIPSGMRHKAKTYIQKILKISIHSSQAGWDSIRKSWGGIPKLFQSTHPKRDETLCLALRPHPLKISIHSSQAGWDLYQQWEQGKATIFQSTHPKRDETKLGLVQIHRFLISIHSSQAGWDLKRLFNHSIFLYFNPLIPSGMRLAWQYCYVFLLPNFNPLIPSGMRLKAWSILSWNAKFQSTHPKRDETHSSPYSLFSFLFQSTHPKRDETACCSSGPR